MFRLHYPTSLSLVFGNARRWRTLGASRVDWLAMVTHHRWAPFACPSLQWALAEEYDSLGFIAQVVWS